jgi:hypothetical protein
MGYFLLATASRPSPRLTQPRIHWVTGALSPGVKQPGSEADHSPASRAEVKNAWSCTSALPQVFMALCLIKQGIRVQGAVLSEA